MPRKAMIAGRANDIDLLVRHFPSGPATVKRGDAEPYITHPELDAVDAEDGPSMRAVALRILSDMNGLVSATGPRFQPAALTGRFEEADGGRSSVVTVDALDLSGTLDMVKIEANGVVIEQQVPSSTRFLELASRVPAVRKALQWQATRPLEWHELYKVFEIIEADVEMRGGKFKDVVGLSTREIGNFTYTANSPAASGDQARHAVDAGPGNPSRTLTLANGQAVAGQMLLRWMDWLIAEGL